MNLVFVFRSPGMLAFYKNEWKGLLILLIVNIFYSYAIAYIIMPIHFYRTRYLRSAISFIISTSFLHIMVASLILTFGLIRRPDFVVFLDLLTYVVSVQGPAIYISFWVVKIYKTWYSKEEEKRVLLKATSEAEVQLLKAQVHPHFFFNTLNNIYSFAVNRSPKAQEMVLHLSDMMKYMIDDCQTERVPLEKELKMMQDYIGLEKERYGERLELLVEITGDDTDKYISPLLMLPFIENCFKHGSNQVLDNAWIGLQVFISEDKLYFNLQNSKPVIAEHTNGKNGIGIANVRQRLSILYPGNHTLAIESDSDKFNVRLQVPLETKIQTAYASS